MMEQLRHLAQKKAGEGAGHIPPCTTQPPLTTTITHQPPPTTISYLPIPPHVLLLSPSSFLTGLPGAGVVPCCVLCFCLFVLAGLLVFFLLFFLLVMLGSIKSDMFRPSGWLGVIKTACRKLKLHKLPGYFASLPNISHNEGNNKHATQASRLLHWPDMGPIWAD